MSSAQRTWSVMFTLLVIGCGADGSGTPPPDEPIDPSHDVGSTSAPSPDAASPVLTHGEPEASINDAAPGVRADAVSQDSARGTRVSDAAGYDGPIGATNVWTNVTPTGVNLSSLGNCGNYGAESVQRDPARPSDLYAFFMCQGLWRSTDYGQTWKGPINVGKDGATAGDCAGAVKLPPNDQASPPTMYLSCIRGAGIGFWRSTNGGVDWTRYQVAPAANNQQFYPPAVDPYDPKHLLMAGHGFDLLAQSLDGGETWSAVPVESVMINAGTGGINFIDTGDPATTRTTWLWMASDAAIGLGTWRTSNSGASWTKVEIERPSGRRVGDLSARYGRRGVHAGRVFEARARRLSQHRLRRQLGARRPNDSRARGARNAQAHVRVLRRGEWSRSDGGSQLPDERSARDRSVVPKHHRRDDPGPRTRRRGRRRRKQRHRARELQRGLVAVRGTELTKGDLRARELGREQIDERLVRVGRIDRAVLP